MPKDKRSGAKAFLSAISNKLSKRKTIPLADLQALLEQVKNAYTNFIDLYHEYSSAVSEDEKFFPYRTVGGLSLDDYLAQSETLYNTIELDAILAFKHFFRDAFICH